MKLGINLLNFGPSATPANFERWAAFAEDTGFDALMISDHVAVTTDVQAKYPAPFYDPFTLLASIANRTKRIEIGTSVAVLPYRHPLQVARVAANIDVLSSGRLILGVGVGWAKEEFQALGLPFEHRGAMANECLDVIKQCWTHDVVSYAGRFFSFTDVHTGPQPRRQSHPPIWVGGASDAAIRRAVRYGDAWHPIRPRIDWLRYEGMPRLQEIASKENRKVPALCPRILLDPSTHSIMQLRDDLSALEDLGAEYVVLDTYSGRPEDGVSLDQHWASLAEVITTSE
jgi:probable F420-dependent oxidoreductase